MKNVSKFTITKDLLKSCKSVRRLYEEHLQSKKVESVKKSLSTEISSFKGKLGSELKQGQMWRKILLSIPKKLINLPWKQRCKPTGACYLSRMHLGKDACFRKQCS